MDSVLNTLGLCKRANKLVSGEAFVLNKIKSQSASIVFLANDAGKNTTKRITDKTTYYNIRLVTRFSTDELNKAIGLQNRKVLAVEDKNFTNLLIQKLDIKERWLDVEVRSIKEKEEQ